MPFAQLTAELRELIKTCKKFGEPVYRYFYKKDRCPIVITESVHDKYIDIINKKPIHQRSKSSAILKVERVVKKLHSNLNPDGTYIINSINLNDAIDFITSVMELVENNWLENDDNNGYLKISVNDEIMSCSSPEILSRNFGCYDLENELRFVIHKESHEKKTNNNDLDIHIPPKETHEKKKGKQTNNKEEVHQPVSRQIEEKQRKTSMSKEERESRPRCVTCGSINCNGEWITYKRSLPPTVQNSKNALKRVRDAFKRKHSN